MWILIIILSILSFAYFPYFTSALFILISSPMTALSYYLEASSFFTILRIPNSFLTFLIWCPQQIIIRGKCFFGMFQIIYLPAKCFFLKTFLDIVFLVLYSQIRRNRVP